MRKKTVRDIDVSGRRVFVRVDFNVPIEQGRISDDHRITAALPTIAYLRDHGAAVILASHLGRPKGPDPALRMDPVARRLAELLHRPVPKFDDCVGPEVDAAVGALAPGDVVLLENLRFHKEEEANDPAFARALASTAQIYVNDAFGTAHRAHASTVGVAKILPAVAGLLMERELLFLGKVLEAPTKPLVVILGGKKVEDKIGVIRNLLRLAQSMLIGGGMCYTFLRASGGQIGGSLCEEDKLDLAGELMGEANDRGVRLLLPLDVIAAQRPAADAEVRTVSARAIPDGWMGLDIGLRTEAAFGAPIAGAGTVLWNGPMGVFELAPFSGGTRAIAKAVAESCAESIVGGGDTASAVEQFGYADKMTHVSTGGGATLEFMEGKVLPGVAVLEDAT
ncbi:MAG TPA: phosphoglycerate kinase [bacterium]|nr:phosphoglycerate kinase [bacterium]